MNRRHLINLHPNLVVSSYPSPLRVCSFDGFKRSDVGRIHDSGVLFSYLMRGVGNVGSLGLVLLDVCETTSLGMDILDLTRCLGIEVDNLLASRGAGGLLVKRVQPGKYRVGPLRNAVRLIHRLGLLSSLGIPSQFHARTSRMENTYMVLLVNVLEGLKEFAGDAVLLVKIYGVLGGLVTD
jgi:hypothetical protein